MFNIFNIFRKKRFHGATSRNGYLDDHGYYLSMDEKKSLSTNHHSALQLPYAISDLICRANCRDLCCYVRWSIYSYRWALHNFKHTSSNRISMRKKSSTGHRHFVRDSDLTRDMIKDYADEHQKRFDLMIFDGPGKHDFADFVPGMLTDSGVVVMVDDFSDPYDFETALEKIRQANFKVLLINNPAPLFHNLPGAIIYRDGNFLGI